MNRKAKKMFKRYVKVFRSGGVKSVVPDGIMNDCKFIKNTIETIGDKIYGLDQHLGNFGEDDNDRFLEMNYLIHHINNSFAVLYSAVCIASGEEDEP